MLFGYANENDSGEIEKCARECLPLYYSKNELIDMMNDEKIKILKVADDNKFVGFIITRIDENDLGILCQLVFILHIKIKM